MTYVKVLVADATYHGKEALTYSTNETPPVGAVVLVEIKSKHVLGIVTAVVSQPNFAVKPITTIYKLPPIPLTSLALLEWIKPYYPAPLGVTTSLFLPAGLTKNIQPVSTTYTKNVEIQELPPLTVDQKNALSQIQSSGFHLLHGETGTGKTRIYVELARRTLSKGRSAVILTPEIGLTPQLLQDFRAIFGDRVLLLHSQMTGSARRATWLQILGQREPLVVIGPRSALFTPLKNIGLIVVDEAHETAYKQDRAPHYHASHVAAKLAEIHKAVLILGSATPLVTDYAIAQAKQRPIIRMSQTANTTNPTQTNVKVIDLRDRKAFTKSSHLSNTLIQHIQDVLQKKEQALLFLNRRGTARMVFCERCGWQANCPQCDLPLVYHGDTHRMQCHTCAFIAATPTSCPVCHNTAIVFKNAGTKAVADEVSKLFPNAKIQRFDTDNKKQERMEEHLSFMQRGDIDIIIGTQTVAKGLDLPRLGLVGVIVADTGLSLPDFSAQERTYQLLRQVIGRVGRGHRASHAVIQTYNPASPVLKMALDKDWDSFSKKELQERQQYQFPPYFYLLKLSCKRSTIQAAQTASDRLAKKLSLNKNLIIEGPAPAFYEKVQGKYQWQIVVKSRQRSELIEVIKTLPAQWSYDIDPMQLL